MPDQHQSQQQQKSAESGLAMARNDLRMTLKQTFKLPDTVTSDSFIERQIRKLSLNQYERFLEILTSDPAMQFKTALEKIVSAIKIVQNEFKEKNKGEIATRIENIYNVVYALKAQITSIKNVEKSAVERFENVKFTTIMIGEKNVFDEIDIEVIRRCGKQWFYDHVNYDRGIFNRRLESEYLMILIERASNKNPVVRIAR